jgi:hypothetical protein
MISHNIPHQTKSANDKEVLAGNLLVKFVGITTESTQKMLTLLQDDYNNHDLFFHEKLKFHNHLLYHVLAAYSFGATPETLQKIFDIEAKTQRKRSPSLMTINEDNWLQNLGRSELWTDYLNFFSMLIKENGNKKVVNEYGFHPQMYPRFVNGLCHPLNHLGHGLEFDIGFIVAEGLASAAVHPDSMARVITEEFYHPADKHQNINDILQNIREDEDIIGLLKNKDLDKLTLMRSAPMTMPDLIRTYAMRWQVREDEMDINAKLKELYEAGIMLGFTTALSPDNDKILLDFFLMHVVTSVLSLAATLPVLTLAHQVQLLKAHFAAMIICYIASRTPTINPELLWNYKEELLQSDSNPWVNIINRSLKPELECHVIKVVRSLIYANNKWGGGLQNIYLKAAAMTMTGFEKYNWRFNSLTPMQAFPKLFEDPLNHAALTMQQKETGQKSC